jgi:hypothetical protein
MTSRADDDGFAPFDILLKRRGRGRWKWRVCGAGEKVLMSGSECSRAGARYKAERALFLLLCASASRLSNAPVFDALGMDNRTTIEGVPKSVKMLPEPRRAAVAGYRSGRGQRGAAPGKSGCR